MNIHKAGMLRFTTIDLQIVVRNSSSRPVVSREKGGTLRKCTNKDHFRCLIIIWSIGIARKGLNGLIFVKTSNSTKTDIFPLLLPVAQNQTVRIPTHFASTGHIGLYYI